MSEVPVIVGEIVAGEAAKVRKQITEIIKGVNQSTFTLAELLHEVKTKNFYTKWGYDTFGEYVKTLDIKTTKAYYLCRIVQNMLLAGVPKETYEPVGIAKLRVICELDPTKEYQGKSGAQYIKSLTETAKEVENDVLREAVDHVQGKTGNDTIVWLNIAVNKAARDNTIKVAMELAKKNIGTVATDADGMAKDASDGRALEVICAAFLADADNGYVAPEAETV